MKYIAIILLILNFINCEAAPLSFKTIAIVEDQIISSKYLEDRINIMSTLYNQKITPQNMLTILIDEILINKKAAELSIEVGEEEIGEYLKYLTSQLNIKNIEEYGELHNIVIAYLRQSARTQILWQKIIMSNIRAHLSVSNREVRLLNLNNVSFQYINLVDEQYMQPIGKAKSCEEMEGISNKLGLDAPISFKSTKISDLNKRLKSSLQNMQDNQIDVLQLGDTSYMLMKCVTNYAELKNELLHRKTMYYIQRYLDKLRWEKYVSTK